MNWLKRGNWGLKLLSLILAIVLYHTLKNESAAGKASASHPGQSAHDTPRFIFR